MRLSLGLGIAIAVLALPTVASAAGISDVHVQGSFETGGVIITLSGANGNESATLEVKGPGDADFHVAHPFVRYDNENLASSLFGLTAGSDYEVRVTLTDPDGATGANPATVTLSTLPAPTLPAPQRTRYVGPGGQDSASAGDSESNPWATLDYALGQAQAGDEIRLLPGTYAPGSLNDVQATADAPIVIRAHDPTNKPVIDANGAATALELYQVAYVVLDGLEIANAGGDSDGVGLKVNASSHVTVRNCIVHDNGHWNVLVTKSAQFSGGTLLGGFHLIEDNEIFDSDPATCGGASNSACPGQTYYGIHLDNNPGAATVIRNNVVHGNVDNLVVCGDESAGRDLAEATSHVLALTGSGEGWTNHDTVVAGNTAYDAKDDDIELDGICVNARIFKNRFGNAENPISMAPGLPGPYFVLRNVISGDIQQAAIKMNTAGTANSLIRNFFFYHNTIARSTQGTLLNLWYAVPGDHDVPIKNVVFRNNVFWAMAGGRATDANNQGTEHPSFDYDLWYTADTQNVFQWWSGSSVDKYDTFAQFQSGTGEEAHGLFAEPELDSDFLPAETSPVVDQGLVIEGINDGYAGAGPDIGAFEVGDTPSGGAGGSSGSGGSRGGGAGSGATAGGGGSGATAGGSASGGSGDDGGCGCRTSPRSHGSAWLAALALLLFRRRRRDAV